MKKEKYDGIAFDIIMGMPSVGGVKVQPQTRKKKKGANGRLKEAQR